MVDAIKEWLIKTLKSRLFTFWIIMIFIFVVIVQHLFQLQIVNGADYLNNYTTSIEKEILINGSRGNIYDCNGILLAHNELSYSITLEDNGTYEDSRERAKALNAEISLLIDMIEENGDAIVNDLDLAMDKDGTLSFLVEGTQLQGFRRDIFGRATIEDLKVNPKLGYNEAKATEEQIYEYLINRFSIDTKEYDRYRAYQIAVVRYALSLNSYQKYISTVVASDVSDETVAKIQEHLSELQGVSVQEDSKRVYDYPEYFSHIIGYIGKIDTEEYNTLHEEDESYTLNDVIGKAGIEQVMETYLQGNKGSKTVYVNNVGKILDVKEYTEPSAGQDVYLSIDANLQMAVYDILEQELAGIIYSKIINAKYSSSSELYIPIYDVYNALIANSVIDLEKLAASKEGTYSHKVYETFLSHQDDVLARTEQALKSDTAFKNLSSEMQDYISFIVSMLQEKEIFNKKAVDSNDEIYQSWKQESISVKEYLKHAIDESWIELDALTLDDKYSDTNEIYENLVSYVMSTISESTSFDKLVYQSLIFQDQISGTQLCIILYEQGVLKKDEDTLEKLKYGVVGPYNFLKSKIKNLELTPAQLALDPCTGSCVLMDPNTGKLLACVTYPGYDTNRLTNNMDSAYFNKLLKDRAIPLYNNATQQTTAPGSTFKPLMAVAGLTEGVIDTGTVIRDTGIFDKLNNKIKCWIYPSAHGNENVITAIRDSCNYFFCDIGYRFSMVGGSYSEERGISYINKYATAFGLGDKTGLEIPESKSRIADEYPITASIGQSNNNYTTAQLCRYVAAIANEGTVYNLTLLDRVTDSEGTVVEQYQPEVFNSIDDVAKSTWNAVHKGMREVVLDHDQFDNLQVELAGKTGTAQEKVGKRPNHALFVGYAPVSAPEVAVAARIAYGYSSGNACHFVDKVMKYYFKQLERDELLNGQASNIGSSNNRVTD